MIVRRHKGAPNSYAIFIQGLVHTLHLADFPNIFRFLTIGRKLYDNEFGGPERPLLKGRKHYCHEI